MPNPVNNLTVTFHKDKFTVTGENDFLKRAKIEGTYASQVDPKTGQATYTFNQGSSYLYFDDIPVDEMGKVAFVSKVDKSAEISNYAEDGYAWNNYSGIVLPKGTVVSEDLKEHGTISPNNHSGFWGGVRYWTAGWFTYNSGCTFKDYNLNGKGAVDFTVYEN